MTELGQLEQLEHAIAALEAQRATLGDAVVEAALAPMREKLVELRARAISTEQQRKQATVLFADVSGFTAMSETMDAEEVSDMMNALWKRIDAAIVAHGGAIDKHIGDVVMALWGADKAGEDDPECAIRAALAMQVELAAFREERDVQLEMRIGLNTGPVLLGEVRPGEFTAMGDTVNLASRMEHAAPVGSILITHDTWRHVHGAFDLLPQEPLKVKGKAEPVQTYVVQQAKTRGLRMGTRGVEGVETRMVGRDAELLALQNGFLEAMENAETRVVTIVGEAGVGKSRLLHEFDKWIKSLPDQIIRLKSRTTPEMQTVPYGIIRDMFAFNFGIRESDSAAVALEKFRAGMAHALEPEKADLIGHLVGFEFSASTAVQNLLGSPSFKELATAYLINYMRAISSQPIVIFLDNIHWADDSSLDLVNHVVTALSRARLLIVCLARLRLFERRPNWGDPSASSGQAPSTSLRADGHAAFTRLDLKPLSEQDSRVLVGEILQKVSQLPDDLCNLIVDSAEGNPFYIEELVKMLIEDGVIQRGEDTWYAALDRLEEVRVPSTLIGVLQTRLDSLPRKEKALLQRASVVGRLFWDAAVAELEATDVGRLDRADVVPLLDAVRSRELIFRRKRSTFEGTGEYIFKHAILRDVTYETVLLKLRQVYHAQVARWLEANAEERIGEYLSLIAGHYELAGETARAADYLRQSGQESYNVSAFRDAARAFERALTLLPAASHERVPLTIHVGYALSRLGDYAAACQWLEEGLALARQRGDDASCAVALTRLGMIACEKGAFDEARSRLEESLTLARQVDDRNEIAHALYELGWVDNRLGAFAKARDCFAESLTVYQALNDRRGIALALSGLGGVAIDLAEYEQARSYCMESLALCRELGDYRAMARVFNLLGEMARQQGDYAEARHHYQEGLTIYKEIGAQWGVALVLGNLGHVAVSQGDDTAAAHYYREAIRVAMTIGAIPVVLESVVGLAWTPAHAEQTERALELLSLALHHPALASDTRSLLEPILADLRAKLPPDVVEAALERGKTLELETVVAEILGETTA